MSDLVDALRAGMAAAPQLDPNMLYGLAQSSNLPDVPDNATATAAFGEITKRKSYLESQDPNVQASAWASAGDAQRQMLTAAGYQPPSLQKHSTGMFAAVGHFLGDVADVTIAKPAEAALHAAGEGLHYLGAPLRQLQHAYRAAALMTDENVQAGRSQLSLNGVFSPSEWAQMWRASEHGEQTFSPVGVRQLEKEYDGDTLALARQIASAPSSGRQQQISRIILAAPEDQRAALTRRITDDTDLRAAVAGFEANKISFGRRVVGDSLLINHPAVGHALSGALDATADWFGDPVVIGTKTAKAAELGRYALPELGRGQELGQFLVRNAADVDVVLARPQAQRAAVDVAETLKAGGAGALIRRWPSLAPVAEQLVKEGVDSPEAFTGWLRGQAGMTALYNGRASGAWRSAVVVPHLSVGDQAALAIKGGLRNAIDWAADSPARIAEQIGDDAPGLGQQIGTRALAGPAKAVKQLLTLTAKGASFDPTTPDAITVVQRLAGYVLPANRVDDVVNAWSLAPDIATKRNIYKGLLGDMFDAAGVNATDEGRQWASRFTSQLDEAVTKPVYSGSGADQVLRDGVEARRGLDMPHFTTEWAMPRFQELWKESKRVGTLGRIYGGTVNRDGVDAFMNNVWKPTTLLRLGFPIRAGGEELVAAIMREGVTGLLRGRLAAGAAEGEAAGSADRLLPFHPLSAVWDRYMGPHIPEQVRSAIETPADFAGAVIGERTRRAFRTVEGRLAGQKYMDAARELWTRGPLQEAFTSEIAATESRAAGYLDDGPSVIKASTAGAQARPAYFSPTGNFREYRPQDDLYVHQWKKGLDELGNGPLFKAALDGAGGAREAQVQAVVDRINSPGYEKAKALADRSLFTRDGAIVGHDATQEAADRDWAEAVVDHVNSLVHDENGTLIPDIADRVKAGDVPTVAELSDVPLEARPGPVKGREMQQVSRNWVRDVMDRGFEQVVGRPMDWMVRQPLFVHNYATSLDEVQGLRSLTGAGDHADELVHQVAIERAINKTVPFIHDPQMRSQFSVVTRNLAPFWFAQEQFYKRWAKVAVHSPEAFREAQLVMMGFRHAGVVHTDQDGNDYFLYPGAAVVQQALSKGYEMFTGHKVSVPLPVGFSGQVRFATPGLERLGVPSFGPLVGVPVHALAERFPELSDVEAGVLGERGAGRAYWEQVTPTTVSRLVHVITDRPDSSPQMASAMMQAMAYLEATGHAPANDAGPVEREAYIDRVRNWTRILLLNRTLYGFSTPASPELQLDPNQLHSEFRDLLTTLPIEEATAEFMRRHPDASPYTVFQSKSASGAPLPATAHTAAFMEQNDAFLQTYPQASGWLIPQTPEDTKFSLPAYREQLALQLRDRKSPEEFYRDLKFSEAADVYFRSRDNKDAALKTAHGAAAQNVNHAWATWKQDFLAGHPVFAEELQSPDATIRRQQTLDQLHQAFSDPRLPQTPQTEAVGALLRANDQVQVVLLRLAGNNSGQAVQQRKAVKDAFGTWATNYVADHPEAKGVYDRVFRPLIET